MRQLVIKSVQHYLMHGVTMKCTRRCSSPGKEPGGPSHAVITVLIVYNNISICAAPPPKPMGCGLKLNIPQVCKVLCVCDVFLSEIVQWWVIALLIDSLRTQVLLKP